MSTNNDKKEKEESIKIEESKNNEEPIEIKQEEQINQEQILQNEKEEPNIENQPSIESKKNIQKIEESKTDKNTSPIIQKNIKRNGPLKITDELIKNAI